MYTQKAKHKLVNGRPTIQMVGRLWPTIYGRPTIQMVGRLWSVNGRSMVGQWSADHLWSAD